MLRPLLAILLAIILSGCGSAFVYNRLDFILPWYVNDYARLDTAQEKLLDDMLVPFLDWHRNQELPCYALLLSEAESILDSKITAAQLADIGAEFEAAWYRIEDAALDWLLPLGERLSDEQVKDFLDELQEQQREYEDKYLSRSDREFYEDSYDNLLENAEEFLGRLSVPQRGQLRNTANDLLRSDRVWLDERAAFLERLGMLMRRNKGWQQEARDMVTAPRSKTLSGDYQRVFEHNVTLLYELMASLLNGRTERQDAHLRERLGELRLDIEILSVRAECVKPAA